MLNNNGTKPGASLPASHSINASGNFDHLPDSAFVRAHQLANNSKRPPAPVPLPFSEQTMWRKVKAGAFPAPKKFGPQITAWNVGEVRAWLKAQTA